MFCRNCGKNIGDSTAELCPECQAMVDAANAPAPVVEQPAPIIEVPTLPVENPAPVEKPAPYQQNAFQQPYQPVPTMPVQENKPAPTITNMYGFGYALTACILAFFSVIFSYMSMASSLLAYEGAGLAVYAVLMIFTLAMFVISIVFGIKGITSFSHGKKAGVKPIASLVLGICALSLSFFTLIFMSLGSCVICEVLLLVTAK